jgi:hypothetical protein
MASLENLADNISKLWGAFRELAADYWGPNKDNGRRSEIAELRKENAALNDRIGTLEDSCRHYFDAQRAETCIGKKLLADHEAKHNEKREEEAEVKIAQGNNRTLIVQQWVQIAGLVAVALIGLFK